MPQRQDWFEGWRLLAVLTLSLIAPEPLDRRRCDNSSSTASDDNPLHRAHLAAALLPGLRGRRAGTAAGRMPGRAGSVATAAISA